MSSPTSLGAGVEAPPRGGGGAVIGSDSNTRRQWWQPKRAPYSANSITISSFMPSLPSVSNHALSARGQIPKVDGPLQ